MNMRFSNVAALLGSMLPLLMWIVVVCSVVLPVRAADVSDLAPVHPTGGERCAAGGLHSITWDTRAVQGSVDIILWNADRAEWSVIALNAAASGSFDWQVPSNFRGERFRVKVQSSSNPQQFQMSTTFFYIVAPQPDVLTTVGQKEREQTVSSGYTLRLYPSPASDAVYIACSDIPTKVILRNSIGQVVYASYSIAGATIAVNIQSVANGLYNAEVQFSNGHSVYRTLMVSR